MPHSAPHFDVSQMKTFVFDADGVICIGGSFSVALERDHEIPHYRLVPFFDGPFSECLIGRSDLKEIVEPYAAEWGWRGSIEDLLAYWFECEHVICPDALACVRSLRKRGHRCVLGTNQEKYRTAYLRREMCLSDEFDHVFSSCELGAAKPSKEFFSRIQKYLGLPGTELCLIDDSEKNISGAIASGWAAVLYQSTSDIEAINKEPNPES